MYQKISTFALTLVAGATLLSGASLARDNDRYDNNGRGNNDRYQERSYNNHDRNDRNDWRNDRDDRRYSKPAPSYRVNLSPAQYRDLNRRMETAYWQRCSVSSHGRYYDCSPARYSRVNYVVGRPLPRHAQVWDVPYNVRYSLPRPYANTRYVWVDRDILLIDQRDNTILDIIRAVLH